MVGMRTVVAPIEAPVVPVTDWVTGARVMAELVMAKVTEFVADPATEPVAVMPTVADEFAVGVPENAPVVVLKFRPVGTVPEVDANEIAPLKFVPTGAVMEIGQFRRPVTVCAEGNSCVRAKTSCVRVPESSTHGNPKEMSTSNAASLFGGTKRRYSMLDVLAYVAVTRPMVYEVPADSLVLELGDVNLMAPMPEAEGVRWVLSANV